MSSFPSHYLACKWEKYKSVLFLSFQGIMLVYDITSEKSFENIKNWIRNIEEVSFGSHEDLKRGSNSMFTNNQTLHINIYIRKKGYNS